MPTPNQQTGNPGDDPLARWRVRASDSVTLGAHAAAALVTFEGSSRLLAIPFSSLAYAVLDTKALRNGQVTEELKLAFGSHVVTVWGFRLTQLLQAISDRTAVSIRGAPPSAALCQAEGVVVVELQWVEVAPPDPNQP